MKKIINKHMIILFALVVSILLMTTMYAAINSVTGDIQGKVIAEKQTGVYITDVQYVSDVNADLGVSTITNFKGTFMQNTVKLSNTNSASEIKYKVTVYNSSDKSYPFLAVLYDEEFYDNPNIIFEISAEGYKIGDIINPHETRDIFITFKYKDGQIPQNTTLNANLNFKIAEPNRMMVASNSDNGATPYLRGNINKDKIETIKFELGKIEPQGTISSFDASEKQDGSIMGYYTDANNDGLYDLTFASNEPIFANTNASFLFNYLINLKSIEFNNCSTFGVTDMAFMFFKCEKLTNLNVSNFNTSQVTNMRAMFGLCNSLTNLDVSNFKTSQVTDMAFMVSYCEKLTSLDLSKFDTSQVTNMSSMFQACSLLTNLNVSNFNTSQVTDMAYMFYKCEKLTNLNVSNFNTSQVTNMQSMFSNCSGLTSLDINNFNTSHVNNTAFMFSLCNKLISLDLSKFDTSQVTNMSSMFQACSLLTNLNVSNFNTSRVTDMAYMFYKCEKLTNLNVSNFNTSQVTDMAYMFYKCEKLTNLNVSNFNTSQVTNMQGMFTFCKNLVNIEVSNFNTDQVTNMKELFMYCEKLEKIDVSNFNTSKVTNMNGMFYYCPLLTSLDLSSFNTSKVTDMSIMFQFCYKLTTIYVTNGLWTTSAVTASRDMFTSSTKLVGGKGTKYDANHIDKEYARIDMASTPGYFTDSLGDLSYGLIRNYNAQNNTASEHSNTTTTWLDLAGNCDGSITGGTWSNEYISLDGVDDWVNLGQVTLTNTATLEAIIEVNAYNNDDDFSTILANYNTGGIGLHLTSGGFPEFQIYSEDKNAYISIQSDTALGIVKKYHLLGIYDGMSMKLYVNGELKAEKAVTGKIKEPNYNVVMAIGSNPNRNSNDGIEFANINVYSARIWDRPLNEKEINQIGSGLIRRFDASNNTGNGHSSTTTTWTDLAGNYNGNITGGTWSDEYISLDGVDDWINLGQVNIDNAVTLEATIELNEIQSNSSVVIGNINAGGTYIMLKDGKPYMSVYITEESKYVYAESGESLVVGEKYNLVGTFDGKNIKLYVNGELKAETEVTGTYKPPINNTVMAIGSNPDRNSNEGREFANIKVYSARVYDVALTQEQIIKNYYESLK